MLQQECPKRNQHPRRIAPHNPGNRRRTPARPSRRTRTASSRASRSSCRSNRRKPNHCRSKSNAIRQQPEAIGATRATEAKISIRAVPGVRAPHEDPDGSAISQAVNEVTQIVESLRQALEQMEDVLELVEHAERQKLGRRTRN